jgi:hypothetical protein
VNLDEIPFAGRQCLQIICGLLPASKDSYLGGAVLCAVGLTQIFWKRK